MNQTSPIQKLAWVFAALFFVVFIITNIPAFNDAQGRNFGLFKIDPIDNIVHLLTVIIGAVAAWYSARFSRWFFLIFGLLYGLDAYVGLVMSRGLLDFSVFTRGSGSPDFSIVNIAINAPHVAIAAAMIFIGVILKSENKLPTRFGGA